MVALRRAAGDSCRRVAAFLQANMAAAVLQVVLVALLSMQASNSILVKASRCSVSQLCILRDAVMAELSMANAMVRGPAFVAFWACFVSRVRPPSGPDRRVGALR